MNTAIALGVRPLEVPDPSAPMQKALTLQALMGQRDMQGLQLAEAKRSADRNARYDALAGSSGSMDEFMSGYEKLDPVAAQKLRADQQRLKLEGTKGQNEVNDQQTKMMIGLANSIVSLPPEQQAVAYPQMAAEWKRLQLPGSDRVPDQWDASMLPNLQAIAGRGLTSDKAIERIDVQGAVPPTASALGSTPVVAEEIDPTSGAIVRALGGDQQMPAVSVDAVDEVAKKRAEAEYARSRRTPAGLALAKDLEAEADRLEKRGLEMQKLDSAARDREEVKLKREQDARAAQDKRAYDKGEDYFKRSDKLRDDYTKASAPFVSIRDAYTRLKAATKSPSAAGDIALIFGYMRMLDPSSTVREGEFATAQNAAGVPDQVRNMWNKLLTGERLQDTQRKDFIGQAESIYSESKANHDSLKNQFAGLAKRVEVDPQDVVLDYSVKESKPGQGPRKGAGAGTEADPFKIKGQDGFDSMPSGSFFTGPDGSLRRKP